MAGSTNISETLGAHAYNQFAPLRLYWQLRLFGNVAVVEWGIQGTSFMWQEGGRWYEAEQEAKRPSGEAGRALPVLW